MTHWTLPTFQSFPLQFTTILFVQMLSALFPGAGDRYDSHLVKGDAYYRSFDNANALLEYHKAYALAPDSLSTLLRLVRTYNDQGRLNLETDTSSQAYYQKALEYAEIMVRLYPNRAESHFWLALGRGSLIPFRGVGDRIRIGKEVQAEACKALELDSTFSHAYVVLAIFQREGAKLSWFEKTFVRLVFGRPITGSLEESENLLLTALKYDQKNTFAYYELYWTYSAMGRSDNALTALRSVVAIHPANARELQQRGEATKILRRSVTSKSE